MTSDDDSADWERVLDARSTPADLEQAIARYTAHALADLRAQLAADRDLTEADRARALSCARPFVQRQTREALEGAYARLRPVH